jgi:2-isopropylmalate synthase
MEITLYDTTLRDGMQQEGLSLTVADKLRVVSLLDRLGIPLIEGGWPGSNPKDRLFFEQAEEVPLHQARLAAFGATRRPYCASEDDANLRALVAARTPVVTVFGKSWDLHVRRVLKTSADENLRMIDETVRFLRDAGREVIYDAEHFFDGYKADASYALETISAAAEAGAAVVVLCDTNGGALPSAIRDGIQAAQRGVEVPLGIHAHDDGGLAIANSLAAVEAGVAHVQGTINGYGERCGNADLCVLIPTLCLKMGRAGIPEERLADLTPLAECVSEIANRELDPQRPYVGRSAFAHKGGIHVNAFAKCRGTYQHVEPERVGNRSRVIVSELGGKANVLTKAAEIGIALERDGAEAEEIVRRIKALEERGYQFEEAEASIELMMRRTDPDYRAPFALEGFHVLVHGQPDGEMLSEASVKLRVENERIQTAADGNGPVNALDAAVRKGLLPLYPRLGRIRLTDYRVRILDGDAGTAARIRVLITSSDGERTWCTVGCGTNVIEASWTALADALEYALVVVNGNEAALIGAKEAS